MKNWQAKNYFILVCLLFAIYLVPGFFYWNATRPDIARCLWGQDSCSLTFATYVLVFVTACAFVAAAQAGWYALQTYKVGLETLKLERTPIVGIQSCREEEHVAKIGLMLHGDYTHMFGFPGAQERTTYYEMSYDFANLGRTPAIDIAVCVKFKFKSRDAEVEVHPNVDVSIMLGNIKADAEAHITIWVAPDLLDRVLVEWSDEASHAVAGVSTRLEIHAVGSMRPDFRGVVSYSYESVALPYEEPPAADVPAPKPLTPTTPTETSGS